MLNDVKLNGEIGLTVDWMYNLQMAKRTMNEGATWDVH